MPSRRTFSAFVVAAFFLVSSACPPCPAQEAASPIDQQLAEAGWTILKTHCYRCHGVDFMHPQLDVLDRATLLRPEGEKGQPQTAFIVPGKPDESRIWIMVARNEMPPSKAPQESTDDDILTDVERQTLRRWIEAGAHFPNPNRPQREFLGEDSLLSVISQDLERLSPGDRLFTRYFSLAHLWNNPDVSDEQLRIHRAAVSKLINSLSRSQQIAVPREVGPDGTILAIDLRDYGWEKGQQWSLLLKQYPYRLNRNDDVARRVREQVGVDLPYVRADWFIYAASRPPLYHDLLGLPSNARALEAELALDVERNFRQNKLHRAAFADSGVSTQNRLVERHTISSGAYWKSYDFAENRKKASVSSFPLGPKFKGNPFNEDAFEHAGGEIIYNLPNGLQAYLLVKNDDERIDEGPIGIVRDLNQFSGSPAVVNGVSCMGCHKHGILKVEDGVRDVFERGKNPVADKVRRVFPVQGDMDKLVQNDTDRFLDALEQAIVPWLREGPDDLRQIIQFPEPITLAARFYDRKLTLADAARELGLPDSTRRAEELNLPTSQEFAPIVRYTATMRQLQVHPLGHGQRIGRDVWEAAFPRAAQELGLASSDTDAFPPPNNDEKNSGEESSGEEKGGEEEKLSVEMTLRRISPDGQAVMEAFYIGTHEVTQGEFAQVMKRPAAPAVPAAVPAAVSWYEAVEFCNRLSETEGRDPYYKLEHIKRDQNGRIEKATVTVAGGSGYRLPTGVEWEYACRAGAATKFFFGNNADNLKRHAWYQDNAQGAPQPVGAKEPNRWGLHDMHGNVFEWCFDDTGDGNRVLRGGSFGQRAENCEIDALHRLQPRHSDRQTGFRIVRSDP